jgi:hypothetical protein
LYPGTPFRCSHLKPISHALATPCNICFMRTRKSFSWLLCCSMCVEIRCCNAITHPKCTPFAMMQLLLLSKKSFYCCATTLQVLCLRENRNAICAGAEHGLPCLRWGSSLVRGGAGLVKAVSKEGVVEPTGSRVAWALGTASSPSPVAGRRPPGRR